MSKCVNLSGHKIRSRQIWDVRDALVANEKPINPAIVITNFILIW